MDMKPRNLYWCCSHLLAGCVFLLHLVSCGEKEKTESPAIPFQKGQMILITNEGNFNWGNASASLGNLEKNQISEDAFKGQNKRSLGDVLQSATRIGSEWWLVVNNSGKIETVDAETFASTGSISGLRSPRYAIEIPGNRVLVSDLYAHAISVVDKTSRTLTSTIPLPGWTEEMEVMDQRVWVINKKKPYLYGLDVNTLQLTDSILLPGNGTSLCAAGDGKLWVGFEGTATSLGGIIRIHPPNPVYELRWNASTTGESPDRFCASATGDTLFFLNRDVYQLSASALPFEPQIRVPAEGRTFYGLGYRPASQTLFVSDAKDYVQKSDLYQYSLATGELSFWKKGGAVSGRFYFY